jgi:hypothetical protein
MKARQAISDVELTRGGWGCPLAYPNRCAKDHPAFLVERSYTASPIDDEMSVDDVIGP